jgi:phage tail-like protein
VRADRAALLLPEVIRRGAGPGTPLSALLDVMEAMHAPAETAIRELPAMLDPQSARDDFVPFLASWVGLDDVIPDGAEFEAGTGRLRQLVATSAARARRRGTLDGLRETLAIATGRVDITVDDAVTGPDGGVLPFHVDVEVPADAVGLLDLVNRLVEHEKPAFVTARVSLAAAAAPAEPGAVAAEPGAPVVPS